MVLPYQITLMKKITGVLVAIALLLPALNIVSPMVKAAPLRDAVVFIPGIQGSRLYESSIP